MLLVFFVEIDSRYPIQLPADVSPSLSLNAYTLCDDYKCDEEEKAVEETTQGIQRKPTNFPHMNKLTEGLNLAFFK